MAEKEVNMLSVNDFFLCNWRNGRKKKKTIAAGLKTNVLFHRRSILFDNYAAGDSVICV